MFHKVKNVNVLPEYKLCVQFAEGVTKIYDVAPLFGKYSFFFPLKDNQPLFCSVVVDQGGCGVVWNDDIGVSCDELWVNGEEIETPFDGLVDLIYKAKLVNDGLSELENGKTVDGDSVRTRLAEKFGV